MERQATAKWKKGLKNGQGTLSTESGVLSETQYSFKTRFEEGKGTNPEELIAAAHAGCFSMALSGQLELAGLTAELIETVATVTFEKSGDGFSIPAIHLKVRVKLPNATQEEFEKAANSAKENCPVSKLLKAKITMDATLASS